MRTRGRATGSRRNEREEKKEKKEANLDPPINHGRMMSITIGSLVGGAIVALVQYWRE